MHHHRSTLVAGLLGLAITHSLAFSHPASFGEEWTAFDAGPIHWFGYSVATADGWRLAGAPLENRFGAQAGAAYLLDTTLPGGVQSKVLPSERIVGARFGWSVDMTEDLMVIGAPGQGSLVGEAFVFERKGDRWTQTARLSGLPGHGGDGFGYAVAVHGDRVLVGAPFDGTHGPQAGLVYAFRKGRALWALDEVLHSPRPFVGDQFGFCLDVGGDIAAIGAWSANIQVFNEGAVFVFEQGEGGYELTAELQSPSPRANAMFARSVAVQGSRIAVGATEDHLSDVRSGSVSLYAKKGDAWAFEDRVQAPGREVGNAFGYSVALLQDSLLVGAPLATRNDERSGNSFLFHPIGPRWGMAKDLEPPFPPGAGDYIGIAVHHAPDGAMVGAMRNGSRGYQAGAVHLHAPEEFEVPLIAEYCDCGQGSPCGGPAHEHGCENSAGLSGRLQLHGTTSVERDDVVLMATQLPSRARVTFIAGLPGDATAWHDGRLCVKTSGKQFTTLETRRANRRGEVATRRSLLRLMDQAGLHVLAGSSWSFQAVYHDRGGPCGYRYNATNALLVTLVP